MTEKRSVAPVSEWKDITLSMNNDMPVFGGKDQSGPLYIPDFERVMDVHKGDGATMTNIRMNTHTGTHMDAPLHFVKSDKTIDKMPLDTTVGPARVIEIKDETSIKVSELEPYNIQPGERIIFKTKNSPLAYADPYDPGDYVYFETDAAQYLADRKVRMVGLDYLTVGCNKPASNNMKEVHDTLLGAEVYIIEGLNLEGVEPGDYELIGLPLKLENADGCPARVILRPM